MRGRFWMARGWQNHPLFAREKFTRAQAWCWLIEMAAWQPTKKEISGKTIPLKRGQLSYSTRYMAKAWRWGSEAKVRRFLCVLVEWENIKASTDAGQTIITICNYNKYQNNVGDTDAPPTQKRRRSVPEIDAPPDLLSPCNGDGNQDGQGNTDAGASLVPTQNRRKKREDLRNNTRDAFEAFWKIYPSRYPHSNPKKPAREKFEKKVQNGTAVEDILQGTEGFAAAITLQRRQEGDCFSVRTAICQATTFLHQERYTGYIPEPEAPLTDEQRATLERAQAAGQGETAPNVVSLHAGKPGER